MRVGIVTQPLYANYGGILQNYALQQVLKKMGHTPVTLDYMPSLSFGRYLLYVGKSLLCFLSPSKRHPIKPYRHFLERPADIDAFVQKYINTTKTIAKYSKTILRKYGIEALVVGSDQVWRYAYNREVLEDMYLAFAKDCPCLKVAYAASFGVEKWDYPEGKGGKAASLAKLVDAVSVREDSGVGLCRENLGVEARTVLDPTLLLEPSDYDRFCTEPDPEAEPYLAAYVLDMNDEKAAFIQSVAESRNLKVRQMTVSDNGESIESWLSSIRNAAYVITDSYHGTLFSILFSKPFHTFINKERGADRFTTIFRKLGIERTESPVDRAKLAVLREESMSFIETVLK